MFLNNRHHDPTLATFISVDPLVVQTGEAYIYGAANPVSLSDPSGLLPIDIKPVPDALLGAYSERQAITATIEFIRAAGGRDIRQQGRRGTAAGGRVVDITYTDRSGRFVIVEVKAGQTGIGRMDGGRFLSQTVKDLILVNTGEATRAEYHFWPGKTGRRASSRQKLVAATVGTVYDHFDPKKKPPRSPVPVRVPSRAELRDFVEALLKRAGEFSTSTGGAVAVGGAAAAAGANRVAGRTGGGGGGGGVAFRLL